MGTKELLVVVASAGFAVASCAIAAVFVTKRVTSQVKWRRVVSLLDELRTECDTEAWELRTIAEAIAVEMHAGLATDGGSKIKMIPTYIDTPPEGTEIGSFYGLDFGGTYYRIARIELGGQSTRGIAVKWWKKLIPDYVKRGTCEEVFDFIALELKKFIESEGEMSSNSGVKRRELGFSFSFPIKQRTVSTGNLIEWTKGFSVQDGVDRDVADCLQWSMDKIGLHMRVAALVNDTVSTFCFGHYHNPKTVAAVVIGTGTNACYLEKASSIIKRPGLLTTSGEMVVNVEWGNFYSTHFPKTSYDESLDAESSNPNQQVSLKRFEKLISGMYIGDIVRRVILRMLQETGMELISKKLSTPFTLTSQVVADMNQDKSPNLDKVAQVFRDIFEIPEVPLKFRRVVVDICDIVTRRSASLTAAGIAGILKKLWCSEKAPRRKVVIVVDGGVYNGYTLFRKYLQEAVSNILGEEASHYITLSSIDHAPEVGAALIAASRSPISEHGPVVGEHIVHQTQASPVQLHPFSH